MKACCASIDARSHKPDMLGNDLLLNILFQIHFQDIYDVEVNDTSQTSHRWADGCRPSAIIGGRKYLNILGLGGVRVPNPFGND